MSSLMQTPALSHWTQPPVHAGLRGLEPVLMLDWRIYSHNKRGIETLYQLGPALETASDDDFDDLIKVLGDVLQTIDGYLKVRGTESWLLRKIRTQRHVVADAVECIKRGYAPGQMPSRDSRIAMANSHMRRGRISHRH